jgi:nucleotide-binding universal stress UspA family protein
MKRILVAIDGSDQGRKALELGTDLAVKFEGDLLILHVANERPLSDREKSLAEIEYGPELRQRLGARVAETADDQSVTGILAREAETATMIRAVIGERLLADAEMSARSKGAKSVDTTLAHGDPATLILSIAADDKADMIVLGSRGFGEFRAHMLGSVSHKVAMGADVTVVTVR